MAKGNTQAYGIDYQETFSPVAKLNTIKVLSSLAANLNWPLHQFDVKNAFLHGNLEEEVFMNIPPGCLATPEHKVVCKLKKGVVWFKAINPFMVRPIQSSHEKIWLSTE